MKLSREQIENTNDNQLIALIKQHQQAEYRELVCVVENGTIDQKRKLAKKMHQGTGSTRWDCYENYLKR